MPVYELMRKDQRVTVLAVNKTGGIEKCDYKNINQEIAPLQERICSDWIERWWNKRAVPLNQGKIGTAWSILSRSIFGKESGSEFNRFLLDSST